MSASDLLALAERVEAASGPDREGLDFDIAHALGWRKTPTLWQAPDGQWHSRAAFPFWTASLDAAMTLVPEGWDFTVGRNETNAHARSWQGHVGFGSQAATPALALTAAALRALIEKGSST